MMKYFRLFIVAGLIWMTAIYSILPLVKNENRNEWYAISMYQVLLVIGWALFFLLFFLVSLIVKRRYGNSYPAFRRQLVVSFLGALVIVAVGVSKNQADFNKWQGESDARRLVEERNAAKKFLATTDI